MLCSSMCLDEQIVRRYQRGQAEIDEQQARLKQLRDQGTPDGARRTKVSQNFGELVSVARPVTAPSQSNPDQSGSP